MTDDKLRAALDVLPRVRLTGEQLDAIDPDPEKHHWVDWDEHEDFVSLGDVIAALAASATDEGTRTMAELGICPVCQNRFRQDGHSFDCPLARPAVPALDVERWHNDGDACTGTTCGNPEHGWASGG